MANIKAANLSNKNKIDNLNQKELSNIHGGDKYLYRFDGNGAIVHMELIYSGGPDEIYGGTYK